MGFKGQVENLQLNTQKLSYHIPHLPFDLPVIVVIKPYQTHTDGFREFRVKRCNIIDRIDFLQQHHTCYSDILINHDTINFLPDSNALSDIPHHIMICILTTEDDQMIEGE